MISGLYKYEWQAANVPSLDTEIPPPLRLAEYSEFEPSKLIQAAEKACGSDTSLGAPPSYFKEYFEAIAELIESKDTVFDAVCLAHGSRVVGVSLLHCNEDAPIHLVTGPCVLMEYCGRGLSSVLFTRSLQLLKDKGLTQIRGICTVKSRIHRYLYPKFGGVATETAFPGNPKAESGKVKEEPA